MPAASLASDDPGNLVRDESSNKSEPMGMPSSSNLRLPTDPSPPTVDIRLLKFTLISAGRVSGGVSETPLRGPAYLMRLQPLQMAWSLSTPGLSHRVRERNKVHGLKVRTIPHSLRLNQITMRRGTYLLASSDS